MKRRWVVDNNNKRAIIAGIAGQDGSYLAEFLLEKGYRVLGFLKKDDDTTILSHLMKDIVLEETELVRKTDIVRWTRLFLPNEVYNFAAMSFIPDTFRRKRQRACTTEQKRSSTPVNMKDSAFRSSKPWPVDAQ